MVTENINIIITTRGATVAQTRIRGIGRSSRGATLAVRALGIALIGLASGAAIRGLLRLSDAATEVGNRIRTVTSSTEVFLSVQERLFDVANRTGGSIADTARLFQRLSVGTRDLGVGTARVVNVVEGLNAALVVSGSTAREAAAALLQLGQGLASDNLSGEELRSLRENLPQLAQELADVLGEPIGALKEMGRQGLLNAEKVFPALEIAVEKFQEKLENGEVIFTFAQAFNAVRNAMVKAFTIIQRATGLTQDMTKAIFDLSDGLAEKLVEGLADVLDFVADLVDGFNTFKQQISVTISFFDPLLTVLGFLAKAGVIAFKALAFGVDLWIVSLAGANVLLQKALRFLGLASDVDVAGSVEGFKSTAGFAAEAFFKLGDAIDNFGERSFLELSTGIDNVAGMATAAGNTIRTAADGLRDAARNPPPEANDKDKLPPDFFERAAKNTKAIRTARSAEKTDTPKELALGIREAFGEGFAEAIKNGGDIFDLISTNLEDAASNALINGFQTAFDTAQGLLEEAFVSAGDALAAILPDAIKGVGPVLGDVLAGAIQFVALQALSALLGGGNNDQRSSSGNVQSAITSTQAVRGIVAGPTEVAIANVGQNIAEAIDPLLQETVTQTNVLRGILANVQSGTAAAGGGVAGNTAALAFGSAPVAV